ncbi:MAG TPA: hypothetical protein DHW36_10475 [Thalassospira sp.]|nr:hypothetical protein [Thalassospira sp.]
MSGIQGSWNGRIVGTHPGNVSLKLDEEGRGLLRLKEADFSEVLAFRVEVKSFPDGRLDLTGYRVDPVPESGAGSFNAVGEVDSEGNFRGEWNTDNNAAGDFLLFPSNLKEEPKKSIPAVSLRMERHEFGAVSFSFSELVTLFESIQNEFQAPVFISFKQGVHNILSLSNFKEADFEPDMADFVTIRGAEPSDAGLNKVIQVDFGQKQNVLTVQGPDENWTFATFERLRRRIKSKEDFYVTYAKRYVGDLNFLLFCLALVFLMGVQNDIHRYVSMLVVILGISSLTFYNKKILRNFKCCFGEQNSSETRGIKGAVFSKVGSLLFTVVDGLLVAAALWAIKTYFGIL